MMDAKYERLHEDYINNVLSYTYLVYMFLFSKSKNHLQREKQGFVFTQLCSIEMWRKWDTVWSRKTSTLLSAECNGLETYWFLAPLISSEPPASVTTSPQALNPDRSKKQFGQPSISCPTITFVMILKIKDLFLCLWWDADRFLQKVGHCVGDNLCKLVANSKIRRAICVFNAKDWFSGFFFSVILFCARIQQHIKHFRKHGYSSIKVVSFCFMYPSIACPMWENVRDATGLLEIITTSPQVLESDESWQN